MNLKQEIASINTSIESLVKWRNQLIEDLKSNCKHDEYGHTKQYHSGGYDYSASTTHTYVCKECGHTIREEENHNSGFE